MMSSLTSCQGLGSAFTSDTTGLSALSAASACYEEEMDLLDSVFTGTYRPSLPEFHNFWRLIDRSDAMLDAMVSDAASEIPDNWVADDSMFGWLRRVGNAPDMLRAATTADIGASFPVTDDM
jgi:hypothetical protein